MVKCGCCGSDARQMHRFFGWDAVKVCGRPVKSGGRAKVCGDASYSVEAEDCFASDRELRGSVRVRLEELKDVKILDTQVTIRSSVKPETIAQIEALADALMA